MIFLDVPMTDLIWSFLKISPLVGAEAIAIWWLVKEMKEKDKTISDLNNYIHENDKDNLIVLNNVNSALDKVIDNQKSLTDKIIDNHDNSHDGLLKELGNLKEFLDIKISQKNS